MNTTQYRHISMTIVLSIALCGDTFGQELNSEVLRGTSPASVASYLYLNSDLIAVGVFAAPIEVGSDPVSLLMNREFDAEFSLQSIVKGTLRPGNTVYVNLSTDMFAYPGEDMSRYEKRRQMFDEKRALVRAVAAEAADIDAELARGNIEPEERSEMLRDLDSRNQRLYNEDTDLFRIQRTVLATHGISFYDKGGSIQPGEEYLIAVNSIAGNSFHFSISETDFNVMWGEFGEAVQLEMAKLQSSDAIGAR